MVNVDEHELVARSIDGTANCTFRNISFCGHTILRSAALVVADTHQDERFADNPLVTGQPGMRFYAGMPLRLRDGASVGSLCLSITRRANFQIPIFPY
jgi:GAF domain-containing protein